VTFGLCAAYLGWLIAPRESASDILIITDVEISPGGWVILALLMTVVGLLGDAVPAALVWVVGRWTRRWRRRTEGAAPEK
jgi:hypothetical protein